MTELHPAGAPTGLGASASVCDVLVIGGGINGAGIARDLAGRGWSVVLAEQDDLAGHTSSSSTKLIHGGLRYLEYYEFSLVRKALREREVLLKSAPHIMWPLRFVMPHDPGMRPAWMIRIGLFLYDNLARREMLPGSHGLSLRNHPLARRSRIGLRAPLCIRTCGWTTRGWWFSARWMRSLMVRRFSPGLDAPPRSAANRAGGRLCIPPTEASARLHRARW